MKMVGWIEHALLITAATARLEPTTDIAFSAVGSTPKVTCPGHGCRCVKLPRSSWESVSLTLLHRHAHAQWQLRGMWQLLWRAHCILFYCRLSSAGHSRCSYALE